MSETEHRIAVASGVSIDPTTGATHRWDGLHILWRFKGERRWRRVNLEPDADAGQTIATLTARVPDIVAILAAKAAPLTRP